MQIIISDSNGKSYSVELDEKKSKSFIGLEMGKVLEVTQLGLAGYKIQITGGSDKDGFPMCSYIHGRVRARVLLSKGPGYRPKEKGLERRKRVRGRTITPEIVQINAKVVEKGEKSLEELLGKKEGV